MTGVIELAQLPFVNLRNRYVGLRHGESLGNEIGIIASHPKNGVFGFGLTEHGRWQVYVSVFAAEEEGVLDTSTVVVSSDFLRARQSAWIAAGVLRTRRITVRKELRERRFGGWELTSNSNYNKVWELDELDPSHEDYKVESVVDVAMRVGSLIRELEQLHAGVTFLFTSHGDPLQITEANIRGVYPGKHRTLKPWRVAEVRALS